MQPSPGVDGGDENVEAQIATCDKMADDLEGVRVSRALRIAQHKVTRVSTIIKALQTVVAKPGCQIQRFSMTENDFLFLIRQKKIF